MKKTNLVSMLVLSLIFLSGVPLLQAMESQNERSIIPLFFSKGAFNKLEVQPLDLVFCEVLYFVSPHGNPIHFEPAERLYWIQDYPVLLLGSAGDPLPVDVVSRGSTFLEIKVNNHSLFKDRLLITPRKTLMSFSNTASFQQKLLRMLQTSSGSYESQLAEFLADRLPELNVKGESYHIDPIGEVINISGDWVGGTMTNTGEVTGQNGRTLSAPSGAIIMWSGSIQQVGDHHHPVVNGIPDTNWYLCDGTTVGAITLPDLSNRFVLGAPDAAGLGATGGSPSVQLSTSHMPNHRHSINTTSTAGAHTHDWENRVNEVWEIATIPNPLGGQQFGARVVTWTAFDTTTDGSHNHTISGQTGGNAVSGSTPMSTLPAYFSVAYIMGIPQ